MELIRLLLLRSEGDEEAARACEKFSVKERAYHVQLMIDASLAEGITSRDANGDFSGAVVSRLTWTGHDFLDASRDDKIWKKYLEMAKEKGLSLTFDLITAWLKNELAARAGIHLF
jgi:hypothetical protein